MQEHVDNAGWATFGTVLGMLTASHELIQFTTSILSVVACYIVTHFLKRYLNSRWPPKN